MSKKPNAFVTIGMIALLLFQLFKIITLPLPSYNQPQFLQSFFGWYWQNIKKVEPLFAPKLQEVYQPNSLLSLVDKDNLPTLQNPQLTFNYQTEPSTQVFYYNKDGEPKDSPQVDGYYRQVLGKTNDNRWVVQDFYQDTKTAQTAPMTLKANSDIKSFDSINADNTFLHFDKIGNLSQIAQNQGDEHNVLVIKDNKIIGSYHYHTSTKELTAVLFDDQQQPKSITIIKKPLQTTYLLYPNTQNISFKAIINHDDNDKSVRSTWDEHGYPLATKDIPNTLENQIQAQANELIEFLKNSMNED